MGQAKALAFGSCCKSVLKIAHNDGDEMTVFVDKGVKNDEHTRMIDTARTVFSSGAARCEFRSAPVIGYTFLQAADIVTSSFYRYAKPWLNDPSVEPEPHFRLFLHADQRYWFIYPEAQTIDLAEKIRDNLVCDWTPGCPVAKMRLGV